MADSAPGRAARVARRIEDFITGAALFIMAALPVLELLSRRLFGAGIPGSSGYVQNLTLWVAFLGALVVTRERRHVNLAAGPQLVPPRFRPAARVLTSVVSVAVLSGLTWGSWLFLQVERESLSRLGGWLPTWVVIAILPVAFGLMLLRFVGQAGGWRERAVALLGVPAAWALGFPLAAHVSSLLWPGLGTVILAALLGAPIFIVLAGAALLLLFAGGDPVSAIPQETARIVGSPEIPMVPLYTLAGFLLAEGGASRRLMRLFQAFVGWMPGGLAVATTLACAFFTAFTGASGVTILALGGVMLPMLIQSGYRERFSIGLLTSTGSLGLLFPPSLPVILYGVAAQIAIPSLFKAGIVPGLLLVIATCVLGLREGLAARAPRPPFRLREALAALWGTKWELLLPLPTMLCLFAGFWSFTEAAAITAVYALVIEVVIHRELSLVRDLPRALVQCVTMVGGVLIILGVSMGLTNYLVMAEVPVQAAEWARAHIPNQWIFLLVLNLFLLVVGGVMEIYAAIVVVVPLIQPVAQAFGVDPLHLGMIFLANMELGFLMPPIGMNLFLSSYRFEKPLATITRNTFPFLLVLLVVVLVITYVPQLIIGYGTWVPTALGK